MRVQGLQLGKDAPKANAKKLLELALAEGKVGGSLGQLLDSGNELKGDA